MAFYDDRRGLDDYDDDYHYDTDYGKHDSSSYPIMPDIIKKFILHFRDVIQNGSISDKQTLYESTFPKLTEQYYDNSPWPTDREILKELPEIENSNDDHIFLVLYSELCYRHIYARVPGGPSLEQRFESFYHYSALLDWILSSPEPVRLELPDQWLWELIDEFIYQFQSYAQYRARLHQKSPSELEKLESASKIWNVLSILNVLHVFVDKSNIKQQLEAHASGNKPESVAGEFGCHPLYKMLGYFSLIGLLRVHSLLGDYYQAIKVLENIELNKKSHYTDVPACQISTAYYVGFAYMMMRRYADAIRSFTSILLYIQSVKQLFQTRTYQNDQINKQTEKMYHLLAICLVLHPQCIDESIQQMLREKNYHEKMYKMQYGDTNEFESCFMFACPKFISPGSPPLDGPPEDHSKKALKFQTEVFMAEVAQQKMLPIIRSYLKLYTTLPLTKLATFMSQGVHQFGDDWSLDKEVQALTTHLLCFKHKMKNVVWVKGPSGLDGSFQSGSELDFYVDGEMVHIADTKVAHRYGDFFIKKILKFEEQNNKLRSLKISKD